MTLSKMHTRVIVLTYFEDTLESHNDQAQFERALGRIVAYGLPRTQDEDVVQLVPVMISKDEIITAYHAPTPAYERREDGSIKSLGSKAQHVHALEDVLYQERPFVLGAVKDKDGTYGFHS